jgi:hypothetical protein
MSCVSLSKFKYATIKSERREAVRIKLEGNIPVTIKTDSTTFTGTLVDISVNGVRVKDSGLPSNPGHVLITMTFFGEHITVAGKFIREQINDYGHFHSFTIDPNAHAEVTISKMIHARQVELMHMLNEQNLQN